MGYKIIEQGNGPDNRKSKAITMVPTPKDANDNEAFLQNGSIAYKIFQNIHGQIINLLELVNSLKKAQSLHGPENVRLLSLRSKIILQKHLLL